jgi:ribonuclease D
MFDSSISKDNLNLLPLQKFPGDIHILNTPAEAEAAAASLLREPLLGFDTETRPSFTRGTSYSVSLLQLATHDQAWLFRLHHTGLTPSLKEVLSSPDILKIGNSPNQDVAGLRKVSAFEPGGFIDLQVFVNQFGIDDNALAKITGIVLGFRISKAQQLSNWEAPVLNRSQQDYASTDAWVCYEIYKKLTAVVDFRKNQ